MKSGRAHHRAKSLVLAALWCGSTPLCAQTTDPDPAALPALDPTTEMAPMPDIGVDWPDSVAAGPAPVDTNTPAAPKGGKATLKDDTPAGQHYQLSIEGLSGADGMSPEAETALRARFKTLSALDEGKGVGNTAQIDRRARADEKLLGDLMRAAGFYDAGVSTRITTTEPGRLRVVLTVEPGPLYTFSSVGLPGVDAAGAKAASLRSAFALGPGDAVDSDRIAAGQTAVKALLGREGFVFAKVGEPEIVIDHDVHKATLAMAVNPQGTRRIGQIRIEGGRLFSARHIGRIARFHHGDVYDAAKIDDLRRALIQTGLVSSVVIKPVQTPDPDVVDITVKLEKAPPRTISGGIGYGTGEGYRIEASWQHRNLISPEGGVTVTGVLGTQEQSGGITLRRNNYKARDRVLTAQLLYSHLDENAFNARSVTLAANLERQKTIIWQKKWTWSYGAELTASNEQDTILATGAPRRRKYLTGAVPLTLAYDGTDDLLNPTRGYRLSGRLSPEISLQGSTFEYVKSQFDASAYLPVTGRTVLAGRVRLGSIVGATADRIAPTRRFYAGGGGSVRGYSYQAIGPVDVNGDPAGGSSLAEFSLEARVRFGDFGVVPFFDAGNLYDSRFPTFQGLRYGAGMGVRYYTSFGPIRVDVGTPINPHPGDARVTVYVSLGQAF